MDNKTEISIGIPEFYKGKSIFITGFTGCVGKLLSEKILFSCPDIQKIYVIIRNKRGKTPQQRLEEVLENKIFNRIREKYPGALESKVVAMGGDVLEERLGLTSEDEEVLRREVDIIFHGAASVRFDDHLNYAIDINTLGTKKVVDLALKMHKLQLFVHISTAYTNCDNLHIEEKIYPPRADWKKMIEVKEKVDPAHTQILHYKVLEGLPNTYVFTKNMGEHIINDYRDQLPVIICRPSIIVPALKEPIPGWTDNKYGPMGLLIGFFLGIIRCSWIDGKQLCNYIMSDIVVNAIITVTWKTCLEDKPDKKRDSVKVYNLCSPPSFNMDHTEFSEIFSKRVECLIKDRLFYINVLFCRSLLGFRWNNLIKHVISALIVDLILTLNKRKPMLFKIRRLIFIAAIHLHHFTSRTFIFETKNYDSLMEYMSPKDQQTFGWDFSWGKFCIIMTCENSYTAIKDTLLKAFFKDFDANRKRIRMLYVLDIAVVYLFYTSVALILYYFGIHQFILQSLISFVTLPGK